VAFAGGPSTVRPGVDSTASALALKVALDEELVVEL
jgi:hypothetical protein